MLNRIMPFSINALTVTGNFRKPVSSSTSLECPKLTAQIQDIFSSMNLSYEEFHVHSEKSPSLVDKTPWSPFSMLGDFEFAEIALASLLNQQQVNALLDLFACVTQGAVQVTLKNDAELHKACDAAAMELTPFSRVEVKVPYKKEECTFKAHIHPLWEWALDILENPFLGLHFTWDAHVEHEHFYNKPWTRDYWWDIQLSLPNIKNTMPFGLILYADKSNLSSFGTAKSYPVIVCCVNLPVEIQNSNVIGRGTVVSWLPIVPEDAKEEGKLGYTTLKCVIWHKSFKKLLLEIEQCSKTGCMMVLTHGHSGKHPCPVYDQLNVASFPHWQNLAHFNQVIHVTFSDGNKLADISKQIFHMGINVLKKSITPEGYQLLQTLKVHLWKHIVQDICLKGATCNYSTQPNESMHKPIQDTYEHCSNSRDIPAQVLWVDHQVLATKLLRLCVDQLEKSVSGESDPEVDVLGAHVVATQTLKDLEENGQLDMVFHQFCQRFCEFLNDALLAYGYQVKSWISLPTDFTVKEYHYLLVNYKSTVTWNQCTDHLRCNLSFFDTGNEGYLLSLVAFQPENFEHIADVCSDPSLSCPLQAVNHPSKETEDLQHTQ
ncbi:hypothetical protein F5J12DRAFT_786513 [Pisolithus orientalis]|uniref:uncharacterized protein n=1 Tax=Pisolithus orientalis TaxID=936130 RepID=UPI0022244B46|nr:uncharacterized protein F5J12DRAFT_786513 [Pisolithus orientalis]KAI5990287.1 hypothetical protein F5J12DRAFT_786513 [Pisolithus orientalis]